MLNLDPQPTFALLIDNFLVDAGTNWRPSTINTHRGRLAVFAKWLKSTHGIDNPQAITHRHLAEYLNSIKGGSWYTHKASFEALRYFFRWAAATGIIKADIFDYGCSKGLLKILRKPRVVKELVSEEMIKQIIATIDASDSRYALRDAAMFRLMATTGIRRGEVKALTLADCYFNASPVTFRINKGKGGDSRLVYPTPNTLKSITTWLLHRPKTDSQAVFIELAPPYASLSNISINNRLKVWAKRAGVDGNKISTRTLRYHYATQFINNNGSLAYLSELLGHEKLTTTQFYLADKLPQMNRHALESAPEL